MARKSDPFETWGKPPAPLDGLPKKHLDALRRYVESVANKSYRTAYDNGLVEGLCKISMTAAAELRAQRNRMRKSK
jgi:hypothetical protein